MNPFRRFILDMTGKGSCPGVQYNSAGKRTVSIAHMVQQ